MKKSTKAGILLLVISVLMIILGIIIAGIVNKEKTTQTNMEIIKRSYTDFSIGVVKNYEIRTELATKLDNFTNETYEELHETYIELLTNYNENMNLLKANTEILEGKCNVKYEDNLTTIYCNNYQQLYENLNNEYVGHLTNYNNKITSYNETSEEDYELFTLTNKEYIDFNNDGTYGGKPTE